MRIPDVVDLSTEEEEFNNPHQVLTPEEWDSSIAAEDLDIQEKNETELAEGQLEAHNVVEEEQEEEEEDEAEEEVYSSFLAIAAEGVFACDFSSHRRTRLELLPTGAHKLPVGHGQ